MANPIIQGYLSDESIDLDKRQKVLNALKAGQDESSIAGMVAAKYGNKYGAASAKSSIPVPTEANRADLEAKAAKNIIGGITGLMKPDIGKAATAVTEVATKHEWTPPTEEERRKYDLQHPTKEVLQKAQEPSFIDRALESVPFVGPGLQQNRLSHAANDMQQGVEPSSLGRNIEEGVKSSVIHGAEGVQEIGAAITGDTSNLEGFKQFYGLTPEGQVDVRKLSNEERLNSAWSGVNKSTEGALGALSSPVGALAAEVPGGKEVTGAISDVIAAGGKEIISPAIKGTLNTLGIRLTPEQEKLLDDSSVNIANIMAMRLGEKQAKFKMTDATKADLMNSIPELIKKGDFEGARVALGQFESLNKVQPGISAEFAGNVSRGAQDASRFAINKAKEAVPVIKQEVQNLNKVLAEPVNSVETLKVEQQRTPKQQRVIDGRSQVLDTLQKNYKLLNREVESAQRQGLDVKKMLAETDLLQGVVDETGTIDTTPSIAEVKDFMEPYNGVVLKNLEAEGKSVPLSEIKKQLEQGIEDSGVKGRNKTKAIKMMKQDLEGLALDADASGKIPLSELHKAKIDKYKNLDYTKPASSTVDKAFAEKFKDIIEDNTEIIDVKAINKELQKHYALIDLLEALKGKKVEGGRLGKYFARGVGAMVGSGLGPFGAAAGAEIAGFLKGKQMAGIFKGTSGGTLEMSEAMKRAANPAKPRSAEPLMLPAPKEGAPKVSINQPINLPKETESTIRAREQVKANIQSKKEAVKAQIEKKAKVKKGESAKSDLITLADLEKSKIFKTKKMKKSKATSVQPIPTKPKRAWNDLTPEEQKEIMDNIPF